MKVLLLVLLFSVALGMKRTASEESNRRSKRSKTEAIVNPYLNLSFPPELFMEIFVNVLDALRLKRVVRDPMMSFYMVSKMWYAQLKTGDFQKFLMSHSKYAYLHLKRQFDLTSSFQLQLLHAASPLIDINAGIKLLFNAQSGDEIKALSKLPVFRKPLSLEAFNMHLKYAKQHNIMTSVIPKYEDDLFDFNARTSIKREFFSLSLSLNQHFVFDKASALDLVKLLFLEDVLNPDNFSTFYRFTSEIIFCAYRDEEVDAASPLLDALRGLILPSSGLEALLVTMIKHIFEAAYIGNHDFVQFLNPNLDIDSTIVESASEPLLSILNQFKNGEIDEFPAKDILLAKQIIKHKSNVPLYTFDSDLIQQRTQKILSDPQVDGAVKRLVNAYL